jgi:acyl-coenzyme A thioesterase PaaI-like protein
MVDVAGSDPALAACRPDWTATQDLSLHATGWLTEGPVVIDARLVRVGKKIIVVAAEIYDGCGIEDFEALQAKIDNPVGSGGKSAPKLAAKSLMTFFRLPGGAASGVDHYNPSNWVGQIRKRSVSQPAEGNINDWIGLHVIDAPNGVIELACTPYIANSIGTINGGVQSVMIEAAAEAMRPELVATDIQLHFLSQLKVGPTRTLSQVSRDAPDHSVVTVELVDVGANNQLLTLATVTLQRPPGRD